MSALLFAVAFAAYLVLHGGPQHEVAAAAVILAGLRWGVVLGRA